MLCVLLFAKRSCMFHLCYSLYYCFVLCHVIFWHECRAKIWHKSKMIVFCDCDLGFTTKSPIFWKLFVNMHFFYPRCVNFRSIYFLKVISSLVTNSWTTLPLLFRTSIVPCILMLWVFVRMTICGGFLWALSPILWCFFGLLLIGAHISLYNQLSYLDSARIVGYVYRSECRVRHFQNIRTRGLAPRVGHGWVWQN